MLCAQMSIKAAVCETEDAAPEHKGSSRSAIVPEDTLSLHS
jgi:hypothetical protein